MAKAIFDLQTIDVIVAELVRTAKTIPDSYLCKI
jgi:hypothetical protein